MHQTAPARPSGDWLGGCVNTEKVIKGQPLNNMVWSAQAQLLHIRTDLFKKHGVKVPTTMAELEDAAKKLMIDEDGDGKPEIYGFLSRGHGRLTTASFVSYLFNFGGSWFRTNADGTRTANLNSKESVDAFEFYGRMIRNYAPKSALNNKPPQNAALYAAGKVAMLSALNFWHSLANDPKKSRIAGNTTTIMVPAGSAGSFPNLPTTSLAIPKHVRVRRRLYEPGSTSPGCLQKLHHAERPGVVNLRLRCPMCRLLGLERPVATRRRLKRVG